MLNISFYDGVKYGRTDFINRDLDFFGNGVINLTDFPLTYPATPNMTLLVGAGTAWVDGYRIANDSNLVTLTVASASSQPRIDIVQIGHDDINQKAVLMVKQGVPGASPIEPGADAGYVKLYAISVGANVTSISNANVTDRRSLVPLKVSGSQIQYNGVAVLNQANTFTQPQTAPQWISSVAQGTAPLQVASSTMVANLNTEFLQGLHADGVVGQRIQNSSPAQDQYWLIGTLPYSQTTTYDKLIIEFQGGPSWDATALINDWVIMGNRDTGNAVTSKFNYRYAQQGYDPNNSRQNLRVVAYRQADGSVQVYLRGLSGQNAIGIVAAYGASINNQINTALPIGSPTTTVPSGTIVFDSGNNTTYPPNAQINVGAAMFYGNVGLGGITPTYGLHQLGGGHRLQALSTPTAPTITPTGTAGTTTYTYYIVATDRNGNKTLASAAGTTTTGNATLSATNYNAISWTSVPGAVSYDVLKGTTAISLALAVTGTSVNDTGQATSAYTAPTRNATADMNIDGKLSTTNNILDDGSGKVNAVNTITVNLGATNTNALVLTSSSAGLGSGFRLANTTATTGRSYDFYAGSDGLLYFNDVTLGVPRFKINGSNGAVTTTNNTLDDGSGAAIFIGRVTVGATGIQGNGTNGLQIDGNGKDVQIASTGGNVGITNGTHAAWKFYYNTVADVVTSSVPININGNQVIQALSGGYKVQSGTGSIAVTANTQATATITYPVAFSTSSTVLVGLNTGISNGLWQYVGGANSSTTGFTLFTQASATTTISYTWYAIGI